jgi:hypothetical protein
MKSVKIALVLLLTMSCSGCEPSKKSACDGFSEKTFAITTEEYRPCAGEIMNALNEVRTQLRSMLRGDKEALSKAQGAIRELDTLLSKTDLRVGILTVSKPQSSERWSEYSLIKMNEFIQLATILYKQCLMRPNQLEFDRGEEAHEKALNIYRSLR